MKRWRNWLIALLLLVGLLVASLLLFRNVSRRSLAAYQAELIGRGEKLTCRELLGPPSTNGAAKSVEYFALAARVAAFGGWPANFPLMKLSAPGEALPRMRAEFIELTGAAAGSMTWAEATDDLEAAMPSILSLRDFLKSPPADLGWDYDASPFGGPRANFLVQRQAAQWLATASVLHAREGRVGESVEDIGALAGQVKAFSAEAMLESHMIRLAIGGLGLAATWELLQAPRLTEAQLATIQDGWAQVDLFAIALRGVEAERAAGLAVFNELQRISTRAPLLGGSLPRSQPKAMLERARWTIWEAGFANEDRRHYLELNQRLLDAARPVQRGGSWITAQSTMIKSESRKRGGLLDEVIHPVGGVLISNFRMAMRTAARNECLRQLTLTAIALRRHELRHGHLPGRLDQLVPEFLPAVPRDMFSEAPLFYRLRPEGGFLLYSVGDNGKDDGGDSSWPGKVAPNVIWDSPDAVWPRAANPAVTNR